MELLIFLKSFGVFGFNGSSPRAVSVHDQLTFMGFGVNQIPFALLKLPLNAHGMKPILPRPHLTLLSLPAFYHLEKLLPA